MTDRDELAAVIHKACGCDGACPPGTARRLEDSTIADAILARWRLMPVEQDVKFHPDVTESPLVMVDEHEHEWWSDFHGNVECVHCGQLVPNP